MTKHYCDKCGAETPNDFWVELRNWKKSTKDRLVLCQKCFEEIMSYVKEKNQDDES